jgi:hypothetical protein
MSRHTERRSPVAADHKKDSPRHIHLFELIERHRRFILGCARELNDHRPESSLVGPFAVEDAGAFEPLAGSLVDPATAVDELGDDDGKRMTVFGVARAAKVPVANRETTSASCPQCSAWLTAQRRALHPKTARISE